MTKLAAACIVYNGEQHLPDLLSTLKDHVDTIVVGIDHKTTDNTKQVAIDAGCIVFDFDVDNEEGYEHTPDCSQKHPQDWSKARNLSFQHVPDDCDWVMWIDSDDVLGGDGSVRLRDLVAMQPREVGGIWLPYWYSRDDIGNVNTIFPRERVFRRAAMPVWVDRVHETCDLTVKGYEHIRDTRIWTDHLNIHETDKEGRNICLLTAMLRENPRHQRAIQYMGYQRFAQGEYEEAGKWFERYVREFGDITAEDRWNMLIFLSKARRLNHDPKGALMAARAAFDLRPAFADSYFEMAVAYAMLEDHARAIQFHEIGLKSKEPDDIISIKNPLDYTFNPFYVIHKSYFASGQYERAIECVERALSVKPNVHELQQVLAFYRSSRERSLASLAALKLARHLINTDEPEKAKAVIEAMPSGSLEERPTEVGGALEEVANRLAHLATPQTYEELYLQRPPEEQKRLDTEWFVSRLKGSKSILHIGSGDGSLVLALAAAGIRAVGLEIDGKRAQAANWKAVEAGFLEKKPMPEYSPDPENPIDLPVMAPEALAQFHYIPDGIIPERIKNLGPFDAVITSVVDRTSTPEEALDVAEQYSSRVLFTLPDGLWHGPRQPHVGVVRSLSRQEAEGLISRRGPIIESHALQAHELIQPHNAFEYSVADLEDYKVRPPVAIFCGPTVEPWSPDNINQGGIGGSETAVIQVARILRERGARVAVFGEVDGVWDGVYYRHWQKWTRAVPSWIFIAWRHPDVFQSLGVNAPIRWLWIHDIDHRDQITEENMVGMTGVMCVSEFHKRHLLEMYPFLEGKIFVVGNGIAPDRFGELSNERDLNRVIYASAPDRGLDKLLAYWPRIREIKPDATLRIYYGFNTFDRMNGAIDYKRQILSTVESLKDQGVSWHGRIPQNELAKELSTASVMAIPGPHGFEETYCIAVVEAQAAGCVPVTRDNGALPETNACGIVVPNESSEEAWITAIVRGMETSKRDREKMSLWAKSQTWENVVRRINVRAGQELAKQQEAEARGVPGTALISIVRDALTGPHKTFKTVIPEALGRGFEVVVAVDTRTTDGTADWLREQGVTVVAYEAPGDYCEGALKSVLDVTRSVSVLWVSDDEEPTEALWERAKQHGLTRERVAYHVLMHGVVEDRVYIPATEYQARLFPRADAIWAGGWDGNLSFACPLDYPASPENTKILWHHAVNAPKEERDAKTERYTRMGGEDRHRFIVRYAWEGQAEQYFRPLTDEERAQLPKAAVLN